MPATGTASITAGTTRLYALDNLRALMMWLGIVLHVAAIHMVNDSPLPWRDERTTVAADLLTAFIHAFRMPVFFILAGFFVAMLVQKRGANGCCETACAGWACPFAVFWPPLFAACVVFALLFVHRMVRGTWGLDPTVMPVGPHVPTGPGHHAPVVPVDAAVVLRADRAPVLWLVGRLPGATVRGDRRLLGRLGGAPWGFALLALPLAGVGALYPQGMVVPSGAFVPPLPNGCTTACSLCLAGRCGAASRCCLRCTRGAGPASRWRGCRSFWPPVHWWRRSAWRHLLPGWNLPLWIAYVYNCASWLWSFAFIGLFLRYLQRPACRGWATWPTARTGCICCTCR
jgi:glucan biosynthesis protein C